MGGGRWRARRRAGGRGAAAPLTDGGACAGAGRQRRGERADDRRVGGMENKKGRTRAAAAPWRLRPPLPPPPPRAGGGVPEFPIVRARFLCVVVPPPAAVGAVSPPQAPGVASRRGRGGLGTFFLVLSCVPRPGIGCGARIVVDRGRGVGGGGGVPAVGRGGTVQCILYVQHRKQTTAIGTRRRRPGQRVLSYPESVEVLLSTGCMKDVRG